MNPRTHSTRKSSRLTRRPAILLASIASLLAVQAGFSADAVFSCGAFTGDADSGVGTSKTYTAIANVIGSNVTVNGATFIGSGGGLSGAGWALGGLPNYFGGGGNQVAGPFGASVIDDLFDGFQYGGNPGTLTLSGLTTGQTYVATMYNEAWGLGADRTQTFTSSEGAAASYNPDALLASLFRYTFVANGSSTTLNFLPKIPGNTLHVYGLSNEQAFNNTWTPASGSSWNTAANWSTGIVPNSVGSNASFSAQAGPTNVTLAGPTTTGHVQFLGTGSYTVLGIDPLTLQADAGGVSVLKADAGGSHTINAPISLASDLVKFGAGTVSLDGGVAGAKSVTVATGTLRFGAVNSYTGGTSVHGGATLDLGGTSQSLGALSGAGSIVNNTGGTSVTTVHSGTFSGSIASGPGETAGKVKSCPKNSMLRLESLAISTA